MKRILAATDFSTRSDRALRRAMLLARQTGAGLVLVHAVDDDQPPRLLDMERLEASAMLDDLARTARETDGVPCEARVVLGDPFTAVAAAADDSDADLVIIGPHRRQILRDVFLGTTAERIIRRSSRPVVMANAPPTRPWERVLIATDFSETAMRAVAVARSLGLLEGVSVSVVHGFDAPARSQMRRASATERQIEDYVAEEEARAAGELAGFIRTVGLTAASRLLRVHDGFPASAILEVARESRADLVIVGTRGRSGLAKVMLGSVAEEVLRRAEIDVLAVPPAAS